MSAIAFVGDRNSPGKRDWSGAFKPEAERFAKYYGGHVVTVPLDRPAKYQRELVEQRLQEAGAKYSDPLVGFFCHGFSRRIELGFNNTTLPQLVQALYEINAQDVALYCCSTGSAGPSGDGGFADTLRDMLCKRDLTECRVLAHSTAGHATMNPNKRLFHGLGSSVGGIGGIDPISKKDAKRWRAWAKRLRDPKDTFRFEIARMDLADIAEALS